MSRKLRFSIAMYFLLVLLNGTPRLRGQAVQVIDMIPNAMSDESNRDTEPFLAINPANPQTMAATAFLLTPGGSSNGPLLVSFDGGTTWVARNVIPSSSGGLNTFDVTIHFNSAGTGFYLGMLRDSTGNLEVASTTDTTFVTPMTILESRSSPDQPYIAARTVTGWFDSGKDRVWVGNNDSSNSPKTATLDQSLDAAIGSPVFSQVRIDADSPVSRDNYQTRTVAHADGHIYAAFYRRKGAITGGYNADIVVVRDDNWGKTTPPFQSLVDTVTVVAGQNVVAGDTVTDTFGSSPTLGNEWLGGDMSITVDQNDSSRVFISYADKVGSDPMTLHLRLSTDYGQHWGADLLTVPTAKNSSIAVNSQGKIGYIYQQLTGSTGSHHWQTHLRRSATGASWDDSVLSDFPAEGTGSPGGSRIIGDYMRMVAVGKNFYGVFSAYNDLVNASFPSGVIWQRNKTPDGAVSPHFLGVDGVTTVASSIDPFFFRTTEMDPQQDFYVRDWTDNATTRDHGQEPSVRADFFSTSDVWNERTNDPLAFDANDRPQSHDPQPMSSGPNFAFARLGRDASGSAADVQVEYFYSDGGVGVNFVSAGSPQVVHFAAADSQKTPAAGAGLQWDLPSGASNHVCLAAQISTAADPFISPSLLGHAPGWPSTDLMIVNDNNKAQRNMQVFGFGGMAGSMSMYARVHNAATFSRDMSLAVVASPDVRKRLRGSLRIPGGRGPDPQPLSPQAALVIPNMAPGENRWVEFSFSPVRSLNGPATVSILEMVNDLPVNGYAFLPTRMPLAKAIRETLLQHSVVFSRIAALLKVEAASSQAREAMKLAASRTLTPAAYASYIKESSSAMAAVIADVLKYANSKDVFGVNAAAGNLVKISDPAAIQQAHLTLLNKLDVTLTSRQLEEGDVADIPQNVRFQHYVFSKVKDKHVRQVVADASDRFLAQFERRKSDISAYPEFLHSLDKELHEAAAVDSSGKLAEILKLIAAAQNPAAAQKRHREFLLALEAVLQSGK